MFVLTKSITHSTEPPPLSTNWNQLLRGMSLAESHSKICLPRGMRWNDVDKLVEMYASLHAKFSSITAPLRTQDLMAKANHPDTLHATLNVAFST